MVWLYIVGGIVFVFGAVAFIGAPYVPTRRKYLDQAFDALYPLGARDVLIDIGSGDGVVLRRAAAKGARAIGYEINPLLVVISKILGRKEAGITTKLANFWTVRFPDDVTVVYTFGDTRDIVRMAGKIELEATRLQRPIAFISYAFMLPGEKPIKTVGAHHLYQIKPLLESEP